MSNKLIWRPGMILRNGYTVLHVENGIVLASNERGQWATWKFNDNNLDTTYSGHYHDTFAAAVYDFYHRT